MSLDKDYKAGNDWNLKFMKNQDEDVLIEFEVAARKAFKSVLAED